MCMAIRLVFTSYNSIAENLYNLYKKNSAYVFALPVNIALIDILLSFYLYHILSTLVGGK